MEPVIEAPTRLGAPIDTEFTLYGHPFRLMETESRSGLRYEVATIGEHGESQSLFVTDSMLDALGVLMCEVRSGGFAQT